LLMRVRKACSSLSCAASAPRGIPTAVTTILLPPLQAVPFAGLTLTACAVPHDATEPIAVALDGPGGRFAVALDVGRVTRALEWLLRGARSLVLEANHDDVLLRTGSYPPSVRHRIAGIGGHLSNRAAADLLETICHADLDTVVLAHLSALCNTPALARAAAIVALRRRGFRGTLLVAEQDQPLVLPIMRAA